MVLKRRLYNITFNNKKSIRRSLPRLILPCITIILVRLALLLSLIVAILSLSLPPPPPPPSVPLSSSPPKSSAEIGSLRNLLEKSKKSGVAIAVPGIHDALSAKIFANAGCQCLFLSGFGVSASHAMPDAGLITLPEMEDVARRVLSALSSSSQYQHQYLDQSNSPLTLPPQSSPILSSLPPPLIVDGDTGHGGPSNILRTISSLATAGVAAVTIEDQTFPKCCTYAAGEGVQVVSRNDAVQRVKAAIAARDAVICCKGNGSSSSSSNNDFLVVARTDCRAALGLEEAIERCLKFEEAGADVVYAENLQSAEEYMELRERLGRDTSTMLAQVQLYPPGMDGKEGALQQRLFTVEEVGDMGYNLALFGVTGLQATVQALTNTANAFLDPNDGGGTGLVGGGINTNSDYKSKSSLASFEEMKEVLGFTELEDWVSKYR